MMKPEQTFGGAPLKYLLEPSKSCPFALGNYKIKDIQNFRMLKQIEQSFDQSLENYNRLEVPINILFLETIGVQISIKTFELPVCNFRIIQNHFYQENLVADYEFTLDFLLPNSVIKRMLIYQVPSLTCDDITQIYMNPWQVSSDTLFFIEDRLVKHIKTVYCYSD